MYALASVKIGWEMSKFLTLPLTVQKIDIDYQLVITIVLAQVGQQVAPRFAEAILSKPYQRFMKS